MNGPQIGLDLFLAVVTTLGSLNAYFIQRLVKKIDESAENVREFKIQLSHVNEKVSQIADLYTRLNVLEKQLAVLEYVFTKQDHQRDQQ